MSGSQDPELSAALGWPGGIGDPVLDRVQLLQMVAALRLASQQALEACEQRLPLVGQATIIDELNALRTALAQEQAEPAQEPVAWLIEYEDGEREVRFVAGSRGIRQTPFYTAPPRREMAPLTEEEIVEAVREADLDWQAGWTLDEHAPNRFDALARAVEKTSWEKNNG